MGKHEKAGNSFNVAALAVTAGLFALFFTRALLKGNEDQPRPDNSRRNRLLGDLRKSFLYEDHELCSTSVVSLAREFMSQPQTRSCVLHASIEMADMFGPNLSRQALYEVASATRAHDAKAADAVVEFAESMSPKAKDAAIARNQTVSKLASIFASVGISSDVLEKTPVLDNKCGMDRTRHSIEPHDFLKRYAETLGQRKPNTLR